MEGVRKCRKCEYQLAETVRKCPICGTPVITTGRIRALGVAQLILGLFLVAMMGTITLYLAPMMLGGKDAGFSGTQGQAGVILLLFGVIIVFGLTSITNGVFQIATGRRNKWIIVATLVLAFVLLGLVAAVRLAIGS